MLDFVYNFLSFLLVFLVKSHAVFESGPHTLLWLNLRFLFLLFLFRLTALLLIFVYQLLGIFTDEPLIVSIVLLLLRLSLRLYAWS